MACTKMTQKKATRTTAKMKGKVIKDNGDPDEDSSDDNESLLPSSDDGRNPAGGGGGDVGGNCHNNSSDCKSEYDFGWAERGEMTALFESSGFLRTNRILTPHDIDIDIFDNLRDQREIEDKAKETRPTLPTGLTLKNDLRVAKTFENVVEHLGQ